MLYRRQREGKKNNKKYISDLIASRGLGKGTELHLRVQNGLLPETHNFKLENWIIITSTNTGHISSEVAGTPDSVFALAELTDFLQPPESGFVVEVIGKEASSVAEKLIGKTCRVDPACWRFGVKDDKVLEIEFDDGDDQEDDC